MKGKAIMQLHTCIESKNSPSTKRHVGDKINSYMDIVWELMRQICVGYSKYLMYEVKQLEANYWHFILVIGLISY